MVAAWSQWSRSSFVQVRSRSGASGDGLQIPPFSEPVRTEANAAPTCHAEGRGFESHHPLQAKAPLERGSLLSADGFGQPRAPGCQPEMSTRCLFQPPMPSLRREVAVVHAAHPEARRAMSRGVGHSSPSASKTKRVLDLSLGRLRGCGQARWSGRSAGTRHGARVDPASPRPRSRARVGRAD